MYFTVIYSQPKITKKILTYVLRWLLDRLRGFYGGAFGVLVFSIITMLDEPSSGLTKVKAPLTCMASLVPFTMTT